MTLTRNPRFSSLLASSAVLVASVSGAGAVEAAPGAAVGGCPKVAAEFVPGTWETSTAANPDVAVGMLKPIADELAKRFPGQIRIRFPAVPAQAFTGGESYGTSKNTGVAVVAADIAELASCTETRWIIAGYSQGAAIAGDVASMIGCGDKPIPASRLLGVGLIADPNQGAASGKVVGPQVNGQGIAGPRPRGFCGATALVHELCDGQDKYCSTNVSKNPLLAGLGRVLSQPTGAAPGGSQALTSALVSDVSAPQTAALPSDLATIKAQTTTPTPADPGALSAAASRVGDTLAGLDETATWAKQNPMATQQLAAAPAGSPEQAATGLLNTISSMDIAGAVNNAASLANTAAAIAAGGAPPAGVLTGPGQNLAAQTAPLTATPVDALATASQALSILKPSVLVNQVTNVATNGLTFATSLPKLLTTLGRLPQIVADPALDVAGKIRALHQVSGDLNNLFAPAVKLAAGVDLHMVGGLVAMIPDPTGTAMIASLIINLLAGVDVIGLANTAGALQEALWRGIESGDWLGAAAQALPAALHLATIGVSALTGGEKTPTSQLGATAGTQPGTSTGGLGDLSALAGSLTKAVGSPGADDLAALAGEGLDAASFFTSRVHEVAYTTKPIDAAGHTAIGYLTELFSAKIRALT